MKASAASDLLDERPHIAGDSIVSERGGRTYQQCAHCGAALRVVITGAGQLLKPLATGEAVGSGCPGPKRKAARDADD